MSGGGPAEEAQAGSRYTSEKSKVRRGLYLIRKYDNKLNARIKILKIDPSKNLTIDLALSNDELPKREKTSSMAARHDAVAAINASFGTTWGRPIGVFAEDGVLKASPLVRSGAFSLSHDETIGHIGYPRLSIRGHNLTKETKALWIADWNEVFAASDKISGYTSAGGSVVQTPENACSARLVARSKLRWARDKDGVSRTYRVRKMRCRQERMPLKGGVVLAAPRGTPGAAKLKRRVDRGNKLNLTWSIGWPGALDVVGGSPVLLLDGEIIATECGGYVCKRHPRTGVGVTESGMVFFVTVDGRQADSEGMTILQFAKLFKKLGAKRALNLDGGGSTTMVVKGEIVNSPSGSERSVASALLVLKGADSGEPEPAPPLVTP
jgi:Phosphodiester glycosidase